MARPLDAHLWVKDLSHKQLDKALASLKPAPDLTPGLRLHQKACVLLGIAHPFFCFWLEMGTGKTLISLELLKYWFKTGRVKRAIVFVTSDKAFDTWERQIRRFKVDLPVVALEGSSEQKWRQLEEFGDGIVLLPYPGALAMCSERVKAKKGKKNVFALNPKLIAKLAKWGDALVIDESTRVANHQSLTYKMIAKLRKVSKVRYALAGRPFGRNPTMLWAQYNIIDGGETLGETLGMFRAAFFDEKKNHFGNKFSRDYTFDKRMDGELSIMLQHRSITYAAEECIDLPKVVPVEEKLRIPEETKAYYKRLVTEMIEAKGSWQETKNIFMRMRQLSSGFIGLRDDETGEKAQVMFEHNPKMDRLLELLSELPPDRKAVVFYAFTYSGRTITERLAEEGIKSIWLWSGTKDSRKELKRFAEDKKTQVAVVNNQLAAMSLDGLQEVANYAFFYESPPGVIDRAQAEARLVRDGQKRTVFQYDLLIKGTVDEKIRLFHRQGNDLFATLMKDPEAFFGTL